MAEASAVADPVLSNFKEPHFGNIPLACVIPSKTNPRKHFNQAELEELAASIKQHGVAQPILVRPLPTTADAIDCVEIVAGERRYRASKLAGMESIPAIVRELTDVQALEIQVIENLQRKDVHPIEEAEGYDQLMKQHGYTADQLAEKVGKSRSYIYGRLKFAALAPAPRAAFFNGKLPASTALLIARIPGAQLQEKATTEIIEPHPGAEPLSYRRAVDLVQTRYMLSLSVAPFSLVDGKLVASAGSCEKCPKRTGNQPELFTDVDRADVCTDPDCFATKRMAHGEKMLAQAKKKGIPVYEGDEGDDALDDDDVAVLDDQIQYFQRRDQNIAWNKKVGDILPADQRPQPKAYVKKDSGEIVPVFEKTAIQEALERAGFCETIERYNERMAAKLQDADLEQDAAVIEKKQREEERIARRKAIAEQETAARIAAYRRVRESARGGFPVEILRAIAQDMLMNFSVPNEALNDIYTWGRWAHDETTSFIATASSSDLQLLIMDMVFGSLLSVSTYNLDSNDMVDEEDDDFQSFSILMEAADIDFAAIRAEYFPPASSNPDDDAVKPEPLHIGDRVRVKDDAKGTNGKKRKAAGKEGTIEGIDGDHFNVWFGPKNSDRVTNLERAALEKLVSAAAAEEEVGDGSRAPVKDDSSTQDAPTKPAKKVAAKKAKALDPSTAWPFPKGAH